MIDAAGRAGTPSIALVFDPHPVAVLRPGNEPERISTLAQRDLWLRELGVNRIVRLDPTPDLLDLSPEQFVRRVLDEFAPANWIEGWNFRFGRGRAGDTALLRRLGEELGFKTVAVGAIDAALTDHSVTPASSSMVRWLLRHGRVGDAARVLGRPFQLTGVVTRGDQRGRSIGFPTANITPDQMVPADGVYAGRAELAPARVFACAVNVGARPTFDGTEHRVEAHLIGPASDGSPAPALDAYGWPIRIELLAYLRDQVRFESVAVLRDQLTRDCDRAQAIAARQFPLGLGHSIRSASAIGMEHRA